MQLGLQLIQNRRLHRLRSGQRLPWRRIGYRGCRNGRDDAADGAPELVEREDC